MGLFDDLFGNDKKKSSQAFGEAAEKVTFFKNANPLLYKNQTNINIQLPQ